MKKAIILLLLLFITNSSSMEANTLFKLSLTDDTNSPVPYYPVEGMYLDGSIFKAKTLQDGTVLLKTRPRSISVQGHSFETLTDALTLKIDTQGDTFYNQSYLDELKKQTEHHLTLHVHSDEVFIPFIPLDLYLNNQHFMTSETNAEGIVTFPNLPDGNYVLKFKDLSFEVTPGYDGYLNIKDATEVNNVGQENRVIENPVTEQPILNNITRNTLHQNPRIIKENKNIEFKGASKKEALQDNSKQHVINTPLITTNEDKQKEDKKTKDIKKVDKKPQQTQVTPVKNYDMPPATSKDNGSSNYQPLPPQFRTTEPPKVIKNRTEELPVEDISTEMPKKASLIIDNNNKTTPHPEYTKKLAILPQAGEYTNKMLAVYVSLIGISLLMISQYINKLKKLPK